MGWVPHPEERYLFEWDKDGEKHTTRGGRIVFFLLPSSCSSSSSKRERERETETKK